MDLHPYLLELTVAFEDRGIRIITQDAEYGYVKWKVVDGVLFSKEDTQGLMDTEYEPFPWHEMPAGGDTAIALENDIASVVQRVFSALTSQ